jgi:dihydrofolate reductase
MARLVFGMNQTLDGFIDHMAFASVDPALFRHFCDQAREQSGALYGRGLYEVMRYWDEDQPEWDADQRDFAAAWRAQPKWVVSGSLTSVGPNATLIAPPDLAATARRLKAEVEGEIEVGGPALAKSLSDLGLIDAYRIYLRPFVAGAGKRFFAGPPPPLRLVAAERIGGDAVQVTYVPA